jgi:hypothetical protein
LESTRLTAALAEQIPLSPAGLAGRMQAAAAQTAPFLLFRHGQAPAEKVATLRANNALRYSDLPFSAHRIGRWLCAMTRTITKKK